ncbi:interferon alpha-inducible protein 27-like protein 2B [Patiria miniata]|uniref:Uncharacterized protein n=1 Tax=Patiria miniata TaxID=46514 RepID=A0A913ZEE5_PATMI|nr:interferon alpha-inducible protein 27-like protein 2B [Patiria miniata]
MWSFSRPSAQDQVILIVNDKPVRGENGQLKIVVSVKAYPDGRVQVCFDDGSIRELTLADFSADGSQDVMGAEEFVQHLKRLFPDVTVQTLDLKETQVPDESSAPTTPSDHPRLRQAGKITDESVPDETPQEQSSGEEQSSGGYLKRNLLVGAICAPLAVGAAVVVLPVIGFGAGGIAAGSYAAGMMSSAAIANGGGVAAGSLVATLQAAGAAGLGAGATAAVGGVGAAIGGAASYFVGVFQDKFKKNKEEKEN